MAGTIWVGFSGSFYQHLAARGFQGLAVGACISTVGHPVPLGLSSKNSNTTKIVLMITDLTFIHQRPQAIASF
jgi:hypothetical protein